VLEEEPFSCCGFCGIFAFRNPEISAHLWKKKFRKIEKAAASLIATDCPGCLLQLRSHLKGKNLVCEVFHTAELFSRKLEEKSPKKIIEEGKGQSYSPI
jgi:Fe-S oxidoreductase